MQIVDRSTARITVAILLFALIDGLIYHFFGPFGTFFNVMSCFGIGLQFWLSCSFGEYAQDSSIDIKFNTNWLNFLRTKKSLHNRKVNQLHTNFEMARNAVVMEVVNSKSESQIQLANKKLTALDEIEVVQLNKLLSAVDGVAAENLIEAPNNITDNITEVTEDMIIEENEPMLRSNVDTPNPMDTYFEIN